jgi:hypothetical protein
MRRYDVRACVIDSQNEPRLVRDFCTRWAGRAWMANYVSPSTTPIEVYAWTDPDPDKDITAGKVKIARTEAMDRVAAAHREKREGLPHNADKIPDFYSQMCAPVRIETTRTKTDGTRYKLTVYMESGPDHYFHASVYEKAARERLPAPRPGSLGVTGSSAFG